MTGSRSQHLALLCWTVLGVGIKRDIVSEAQLHKKFDNEFPLLSLNNQLISFLQHINHWQC